jgi:hypothetical protein
MSGTAGFLGWRWIFILEGLLTFVCALPALWWVCDWPQQDRRIFRDERLRQAWLTRLHNSQGVTTAVVPFSWSQIISAFKDWKVYVFWCVLDRICTGS